MNYVTIDIKNPDDSLFLTVSVTKECEHVQELMTADYVQLSWVSVDYAVIPAGSYIEHEGVQMRLLEPYYPTIKSDVEWEYKPQFHGIVGQLKKLPFMFVNDESGTPTTLEPDFELTGNIAQFLEIVRGVFWKFAPNGYNTDFNYSIEITKSVYLEFQHVDIFSALNMIAKEFETEWFFDNWENTLTFGKAEFTDKNRVPLQVGINVGLPSVTKNSDEYYNTFYVFGSTRNIQQDYQGNNINSIVNKRLTLPSAYKDSCYETDENLNVGERYSTTLIFDDVYPRATEGGDSRGIKIENVRARILYKIDEETGDKIQIGTNSSGPIYETYTKYYFRIPEDKLNLTEDDIFPDAELKCSFETGSLAGYEFSLKAFFEETRLDTAEGQPLTVYKGDFEIQYIEEGNVIIPNQTSFAPREGDEVAFFNIKLPNEYVLNAQNELLQRTIEEVERRKTNYNVYQVSSNPVAFAEADPILRVGSPVLYVDDTTTLETRVTKIVKKLDYSFEQTITVGNKKYQGTISQLKEEIQLVSTNQRVIEATSKMTEEMLQAYKRTQDAILQGFERIKDMWVFDDKDANTIYSKYNIYSLGYVSTKGRSSNESGTGGTDLQAVWDSLVFNNDIYANYIINSAHIPNLLSNKITDFESAVKKYASIPTNISQLVNDAGFITASAIANKADKATTLAGYGITDAVISSSATATTNLNDLVGFGIMANSKNVNATVANNYPIQLAGTLFYGTATYGRASQIYGAWNNNRWFVRTPTLSGYTNWKEIAFTADLDNLQKTGETWANSNYYTLDVNNTTSGASHCLIMLNMEGVPKATLGIEGDKTYFWNRVSGKSLEMDSNIRYNGSTLYSAVYAYDGSNYQADSITLPLALMPNVTGESGDNWKFYDTKFYGSASATSRRTQVAYGYDKDTIHFRRYNSGWTDWRKVAWEDEVVKIGADITAPNIHASTFLTANSVNLAECIVCNNADGIIKLFGDKVVANSPIEAKSTIKIGNATLSYDYASGMLLIDKGIASSGAISTKGISNASAGIASTQFGLIYEDYWRMATYSELVSYGATATLFSGDNATNNGTIVIACDAFNNKTIADVDVFVVGYGEAPSSAMALVPYKIDGNKCYFRLNATQLSGFTGFKIKIY